MTFGSVTRRGALTLVLAAALGASACTPVYRDHGYVPTDEDLALVEVGKSTRDDVGNAIGRPSSAGVLEGSGWYYVGSRWKYFGARKPEEITREVVAVTFTQAGIVSNIERFGLEQGRVVTLSRRVTDTNIKGIGLIRQLMGNVGRIAPDQLLR